MTRSRLTEFLYNAGNLNTSVCDEPGTDEILERIQPFHFHREKLYRTRDTEEALLICDADYRILEILEGLKLDLDLSRLVDNLVSLKRRLPEASLDVRPSVIREFTLFLESCAGRFNQSKRLFQSCLEVLIELKKLLDARDQTHGSAIKSEWVEMEKSIYQLTVWENQLEPVALN